MQDKNDRYVTINVSDVHSVGDTEFLKSILGQVLVPYNVHEMGYCEMDIILKNALHVESNFIQPSYVEANTLNISIEFMIKTSKFP